MAVVQLIKGVLNKIPEIARRDAAANPRFRGNRGGEGRCGVREGIDQSGGEETVWVSVSVVIKNSTSVGIDVGRSTRLFTDGHIASPGHGMVTRSPYGIRVDRGDGIAGGEVAVFGKAHQCGTRGSIAPLTSAPMTDFDSSLVIALLIAVKKDQAMFTRSSCEGTRNTRITAVLEVVAPSLSDTVRVTVFDPVEV